MPPRIEEFRKSCKDCVDIISNMELDYLRLLLLGNVVENTEYLLSIGRYILNRKFMKFDFLKQVKNYNKLQKLVNSDDMI